MVFEDFGELFGNVERRFGIFVEGFVFQPSTEAGFLP
jgi:hypothetical protein